MGERSGMSIEVVREAAAKMLARRALTRRELAGRMLRAGCDGQLVEQVLGDFESRGWLNDPAFAAELCREELAKGGAGEPLLMRKLLRRQVDEATAEVAVRAALEGVDQAAAAETLARRRLASLRNVPAETAMRRMASALARRGFDDETVHAAIERVAREAGIETP